MELEPSVEGNRREGGSLNRGLRPGVQESVRLVASIWSHGLSSIGDVDEEEHGWMSYEQSEGNTGLQRMLWMSSDPMVKLVHLWNFAARKRMDRSRNKEIKQASGSGPRW